jgi:hypothetical protein
VLLSLAGGVSTMGGATQFVFGGGGGGKVCGFSTRMPCQGMYRVSVMCDGRDGCDVGDV